MNNFFENGYKKPFTCTSDIVYAGFRKKSGLNFISKAGLLLLRLLPQTMSSLFVYGQSITDKSQKKFHY